ncbi:peptidase S24/S26A/S26B/S26C [Endogone sp. FLAS-F59071]|nr:peptidase S24/S26A/S26B/S26C [Endogone sp. FLAS-F59071]|eukprot:RUS18388.1 peptidase S24/S26A/S26B/S26C [Endogone sp. FLAS-F59071]
MPLPSQPIFVDDNNHQITFYVAASIPNASSVPPGHVWLGGDNMSNSTDSRLYGPVPLALVKGRVFARVWPEPGWIRNGLVSIK